MENTPSGIAAPLDFIEKLSKVHLNSDYEGERPFRSSRFNLSNDNYADSNAAKTIALDC